jgi:hypothetical protein
MTITLTKVTRSPKNSQRKDSREIDEEIRYLDILNE